MKEILEYQIYQFGQYSLQVHTVIEVILVVLGARFILFLVSKAIHKSGRLNTGAKYSVQQLVKYTLIVVAILLCVTLLGFNLSGLFVGSAAILVGIGFGLQHLFSDFISGIIILFDNTIKVNDVVEVDGIVCRVLEIKLRTTTVMTREDKCIILPNSLITSGKVINWTYSQQTSRFEVVLNIDYTADVPAVMSLLKATTFEHKAVSRSPEPSIRITKLGESFIGITVMFWCSEVFRVENIKSEIRVSIYKAMVEHQITFPHPRQIVHMITEAPK